MVLSRRVSERGNKRKGVRKTALFDRGQFLGQAWERGAVADHQAQAFEQFVVQAPNGNSSIITQKRKKVLFYLLPVLWVVDLHIKFISCVKLMVLQTNRQAFYASQVVACIVWYFLGVLPVLERYKKDCVQV